MNSGIGGQGRDIRVYFLTAGGVVALVVVWWSHDGRCGGVHGAVAAATMAPPAPVAPPPPKPVEAADPPSRLLLLENLIDAEDVDAELEGEIGEEVCDSARARVRACV